MDKNELAKILKPLIKECIKEVIMEEPGVLAHVIKESVQGISATMITENRGEEPIRRFMKKAQKARPKKDLNETRSRLLEPLSGPSTTQQEKFGALRDADPNDSGVDLSNFGL